VKKVSNMEVKDKKVYTRPEVLSHQPIQFELSQLSVFGNLMIDEKCKALGIILNNLRIMKK
jgi:hypothetical protein